MAKKVLTPEEYKSKIDKKADKRKRFGKAFLTTFAYALACVIVFASMAIAFTPNNTVTVSSGNNSNVNSNVPANSPNGGDTNNNDDPAQPADPNEPVPTDPVDVKKELSNSSTAEEVVTYFNSAINLVKPNAKKITLLKEVNSKAGSMEGNLPGFIKKIADPLIEKNMGEKDLSTLDPGMVNATTVEQKNAMFPVENETWSSKLTAADVEKFDVKDDGKAYTITLYIKADEPSTDTAHGYGHNGKVFSVIMPSIVTDNAEDAAVLMKSVTTGHKDGYVKVTIDKATGNVTAATYYFTWTLSVALKVGIDVSIPFGIQKDFTIAW